MQDIGLLAVTESQCTEDEHDVEDEDDSKFRNLGLNWPMVSPSIFDHEKLDVYRVRENASGVIQQFEDDDEHEDERKPN